MVGHKAILLTTILCICSGLSQAQSSENSESEPQIPLAYFKTSGLYEAMGDSKRYVDLFFRTYQKTNQKARLAMRGNDMVSVVASVDVESVERSDLATSLTHAGCDPYDQIVPIPNDKSNVIMYPSCVLIKQCGGCCGHPSLACKPTKTKPKNVQVLKYVYDGSSVHPVETVDYASLEEHTACGCKCKITESDCNADLHKFDDWECKCNCKKPKTACPINQRWDENLCACRCASVENCGNGFRFNLLTCGCEEDTERSVGGNSGSGNEAQTQPKTTPKPEVKTNACAHLRCPRRYKAVPKRGGICRCKFDRNI